MHCNESSPIYVLEITEAGNKRKFNSDNNHCKNGARYTAYVPTRAMAQLAQVMGSAQAH